MREENYFKIKLQNSIDTLAMARSKLDHLDVQINVLKVRFDHDKKVYDDQAIHMQNIVDTMEKRIPELEKKIEKGYTTIDMKTGKAFKSFEAKHIGLLQDLIKETERRQKAQAEAYKQKLALRKKKRDKLSDDELDIVIAEEVREFAQPEDELKANREKEKERLEAKAEFYRAKLAELKEPKKEEPEIEFDTVGNEIESSSMEIDVVREASLIQDKIEKKALRKEIINDILEEAEDELIEALDPDPLGLDNETVGTTEVPIGVIIAEKEDMANEFRKVADLMNAETKELQWLTAKRQDWIDQYEVEEGGKAVWQGRITNGFKQWCEDKGYVIGG